MRQPKYRRHSTRDIGFVQIDGRRIYLPGKFNSRESKEAYRQELAKHIGKAAVYRSTREYRMRIDDVAADYLDWAAAYYGTAKKSDYHNLRSMVAKLVDEVGDLQADQFSAVGFRAWRDSLVRQDLSRSYINKIHGKMLRMFKWAASRELIATETWQALSTVEFLAAGHTIARETDARQPVAWDVVEATLPELDETVADMVMIQWLTGCRSANVTTMMPSEIDRSKDVWRWEPADHKTKHRGKQLIIWLGERSQRILLPRMFGDYCFLNSAGKPFTSATYGRQIARAIERINRRRSEAGEPLLEHWSPHQLRHAKGEAIRSEYGAEAAQAILGHASLDATQIYSQTRWSLAEEIARRSG